MEKKKQKVKQSKILIINLPDKRVLAMVSAFFNARIAVSALHKNNRQEYPIGFRSKSTVFNQKMKSESFRDLLSKTDFQNPS